nr:RHS repeat-associated core domain-containing protein [Bacteroidota bacterium]
MHLHYISGGDGLAAIYVKYDYAVDSMYFIMKDHLGSMVGAINEETGTVFRQSFDAWGRNRNPEDWTYTNIPDFIFDRGYTGHEHLKWFGLINMNGRMYDAGLCRFLSPDPYVQMPDYSQNFNRYSYALNNPLVYSDPSGEFFLGTILTGIWDFGATIFTKGAIDPWNTPENRGEAWSDFDPTAEWSKTNKAWKIDIGGFKTDPNRNPLGRGFQLLSRWTWELPQTLWGKGISHVRNITGNVDNVDYYGGATLVNDNDPSYGGRWGFTLGPYINSKNIVADPNVSDIFRHEYGHTLQSRLVGPLYLTHVALPSLVGSGLEDLGLNDHNREWYETQANKMAYRYFSNHHNEALTNLPWDDNEYPREYKPNWYWFFSHPPLPMMWWLFF